MQIFTTTRSEDRAVAHQRLANVRSSTRFPASHQILYRPVEWLSILSNDYVGWYTQDNPGRIASTVDNSVQFVTKRPFEQLFTCAASR